MDILLNTNRNNIINSIANDLIHLINSNWVNHHQTFDTWLNTNSDYDFMYIYEINFKKYLLPFFTIDTERILSYYSQNFYCAFASLFEITKDFNYLSQFIGLFVKKQFEFIDNAQLFLEN